MTLDQLSAAATELLPCPFCGGSDVVQGVIRVDHVFQFVECTKCGIEMVGHTEVEAIAAWNTRTGQLVAVAEDAVERVARTLAPNLEGGREFDQMPKDRAQLRQWTAQGMCLINDATQDDATWLAQEAIKAAKGTGDE